MKTIAFYLPQYHSIPLNDEVWGQGFTEWVNVKKGVPLFKGHYQPHIPLDGYYCLLDKEEQIRQAKQAKTYCIDAFCYYHYWFSGKMLLEKPAENMLDNPDVDIPFCFCWANEHWSMNWSGENTKIIMPQDYEEDEAAIKKHYDYVSKFFHDKRYLKEGNKPIFIIYKPYLIKNCKKMIEYWNQFAIDDGFDGIYFGYQFPKSFDYDMKDCGFNFGIEFEPWYTNHIKGLQNVPNTTKEKIIYIFKNSAYFRHFLEVVIPNYINKILHRPRCYNYDKTWKKILKRKRDNTVMPGAFTAWDNTPRRGLTGYVWKDSTPQKFKKYFQMQYEKGLESKSSYIFINAWNEWGEGAHLEPDEKYKFEYLEAVRETVKKYENK